jgi:hypothetical protein
MREAIILMREAIILMREAIIMMRAELATSSADAPLSELLSELLSKLLSELLSGGGGARSTGGTVIGSARAASVYWAPTARAKTIWAAEIEMQIGSWKRTESCCCVALGAPPPEPSAVPETAPLALGRVVKSKRATSRSRTHGWSSSSVGCTRT